MINTVKCFLDDFTIVEIPIAKVDTWLSDERLPYDLIEMSDGTFYEIRKTLNGVLVVLKVIDD